MSDSLSVPDPSPLTTAALFREIALLRDQLIREDKNNRDILETRLDAMDKAIELLQAYPTEVDRKVIQLKELHQEKFDGIEMKFHERELRFDQIARDNRRSIDVALLAAKEAAAMQHKCSEDAVAKSDTSMTKQIDYVNGLLHTKTHASDEKIEDLKNRITSIESHSKGGGAMWGYVVGVIGVLATIISVAVLLLKMK